MEDETIKSPVTRLRSSGEGESYPIILTLAGMSACFVSAGTITTLLDSIWPLAEVFKGPHGNRIEDERDKGEG